MRVLVSAAACIAVSTFCFLVLSPTVGFDDANITMAYAENIAAGHGYVYNIGGERVEGSTSPLWTAITTLGYLLNTPVESFLAALGLLIGAAIIWVSIRIAEVFFRTSGLDAGPALPMVATGFLCLPSFFGWVVWSLMDFGLWLLLLTTAFWLVLRLLSGEQGRWLGPGLAIAAALMSITRPEGIAAAFGFAVLLGIFGPYAGNRERHSRAIAQVVVLTCLVFGAVAALRFAYFGDLFPNTFYSKVSTDRASTLMNGIGYAVDFLKSPLNLIVIALAAAAVVLAKRTLLPLWSATVVYCAGGASIYVVLGGDHFGSFRFFLFFFPVLFPLAALTLVLLWQRAPGSVSGRWFLPLVAAAVCVVITWGVFSVNKGDYLREFRIAEQGRERGRLLNDYPGSPTIGIVAAGGVALTYEGHIYDLLGLNWIEMARTNREKVADYINHGGFSRDVFYAHQPDIVLPLFAECDKQAYDTNPFFPRILDHIFTEPEFQELYTFECWRGMAFYRRTAFPGVTQ